jgi:tellurite methyltransferase
MVHWLDQFGQIGQGLAACSQSRKRLSEADRIRWNEKHRERPYDFTPTDWLTALEPRIRPKRPGALALDLACGGGRNSLYLARLGYRVDAWDVSDTAIDTLEVEARRLRDSGEPLGITTRRVDLDSAVLPTNRYDLVLDAYFLDRSLFPGIAEALRPGGLLVLQTFLQTEDPASQRGPKDPSYLLRPGELRTAFPGLETLEYSEYVERGEARLIARRPALAS